MANLAQIRCSLHRLREAACRCPGCQNYFCRECVTEHRGQLLCSSCLRRMTSVQTVARGGGGLWRWLATPPLLLAALVTAWLFFYLCGQVLLALTAPGGSGR